MIMLGKIKQKLTNFIDSRVQLYLSKDKKTENKKEDIIDMSMAEAEMQKQQKNLIDNLKYSFQKDFDSLTFEKAGK